MKRNNVLLGLFVGMMVLAIGAPQAQIKANYRSGLTEVGPMNLGGRVRTDPRCGWCSGRYQQLAFHTDV